MTSPWVATDDTLDSQPTPFENAMFKDRLLRVLATGRSVSATGGK